VTDRSYTVAPHPGRERKVGCPKQVLLEVRHAPASTSHQGLTTNARIHVTISAGYPFGEGAASVLPRTNKVVVRNTNVYQPSCGIGTRVYEAFAAEACELGYSLESDSALSTYSKGFWRKQVQKRRAVLVPHEGGAPSYRIDNPCEHKTNLSGVRRKRRQK
jgi:hypothetical protein